MRIEPADRPQERSPARGLAQGAIAFSAAILAIAGCTTPIDPDQTREPLRRCSVPFVAPRPLDPARPPIVLVFVVDRSQSALVASAMDVDGDGFLGRLQRADPLVLSTDPNDSVLAAEIHSICAALREPELQGSVFGLVGFSGFPPAPGADPARADAWVQVPLTRDEAALVSGLNRILEMGASGGTNLAAALDVAVRLASSPGSPQAARRLIVLLTDGVPTLPHGKSTVVDAEDLETALESARRAREAGVEVHIFGFYAESDRYPPILDEAVEAAGGTFGLVRDPGLIAGRLRSLLAP